MTQPSRTTETLNRDNEAIREIMHQIRNRLTVPDRATLALGLIGHLATLMNGRQMTKLLAELTEEAERVQDVPPTRRRDREEQVGSGDSAGADVQASSSATRADKPKSGEAAAQGHARADGQVRPAAVPQAGHEDQAGEVGQAGRGPVTEQGGPML
jgi:hypothetical protein